MSAGFGLLGLDPNDPYAAPAATPPGFSGYNAPAAPTIQPGDQDVAGGLSPRIASMLGDLGSMGSRTGDLIERFRSGDINAGQFLKAAAGRAAQSVYDSGPGFTDRFLKGQIDPGSEEAAAGGLGAAGLAMTGGIGGVEAGGSALGAGPMRTLRGASDPGMISTRLPTAAKATENPFTDYLGIDTRSLGGAPGVLEHNSDLLRKYPGMPDEVARYGTPEDVRNAWVNHSVDNLMFLHDQMSPELRQRAMQWYDGANRIANEAADKYGLRPDQTSAVYAALSPQKDWFQNVSLGDRVLDIMHNQQGTRWSPEMDAVSQRIWKPEHQPLVDAARGQRFGDLTNPQEQALWLRTYDQATNPAHYPIISPEGERGALATNKSGAPSNMGWGSNVEIAKAIQAAQTEDPDKLSMLLGERHKVRNFDNNIVAPNAKTGDVTIDTHAVAAQALRPLAGNHVEVAQDFKNSVPSGETAAKGSALTGAHGTYGINADAYRQAAEQAGILPRQMQSITWEGVRGLFPDTFKTAKNNAIVDDIWRRAGSGQITADEARRQIYDLAGGIRTPDWAR